MILGRVKGILYYRREGRVEGDYKDFRKKTYLSERVKLVRPYEEI